MSFNEQRVGGQDCHDRQSEQTMRSHASLSTPGDAAQVPSDVPAPNALRPAA